MIFILHGNTYKNILFFRKTTMECVDEYSTHDIDLDCGDYTFETSIIKLANLVKKNIPNLK